MLRWLAEVEDPRTLGLFRVVFAGLLLCDVVSLWMHAEYLYGDAAVVAASGVCHGLRRATAMCLVPGSVGASTVLGLFALSTAAFGLGLYTRVTKWATAYLFASIVVRNGIALAGEQVFGCFLFLLCLSRCGAAYSVDNLLRRRRFPTSATYEKIPAWPRRLMILQLAIAYGVAGWTKTGSTYSEGTAFYYMLASDRWFRFEPWWLLATFGDNLLRAATWGAWWFERLFPLVVVRLAFGDHVRWLRVIGSRWIWASLSLVFSGSLALLTNIGWFVPAMAAATLLLFHGGEVGRIVDRVTGRPAPTVSGRPVERPGWVAALLAIFVGWHVTSMVVGALALPHLRLPVPSGLRPATRAWARLTNTRQFWGMFSPNAPTWRTWLVVDVVTSSGTRHSVFDDRVLLGERQYPYVFIDRRQKAHAKIRSPKHSYLHQHAAYLCRTWRDTDGQPPSKVILTTWSWPLPDPRWMRAHGPIDPRPASEGYRREQVLHERTCH